MDGVKTGEQCGLCELEDAINIFQTPAPPGELCSESCLQDCAWWSSALFPPPARGFGALGLRPENAQAAEEEVGRGSGALWEETGLPFVCLTQFIQGWFRLAHLNGRCPSSAEVGLVVSHRSALANGSCWACSSGVCEAVCC